MVNPNTTMEDMVMGTSILSMLQPILSWLSPKMSNRDINIK